MYKSVYQHYSETKLGPAMAAHDLLLGSYGGPFRKIQKSPGTILVITVYLWTWGPVTAYVIPMNY